MVIKDQSFAGTTTQLKGTEKNRPAAGKQLHTALVVDDSASQRVTLAAMLRKWGYEVRTASDGEDALKKITETPAALIISDWLMPGMNGPQLCQEIRRQAQQDYCYFILLTSKADKQDVAEGLNAGADDYLSKPVDKGELFARVQAGHRILSLQRKLIDRHIQVVNAHRSLKRVHAELEDDLKAASEIQQACIPQAISECNGNLIATIFKPCAHVSGDLVGYFQLNEDELAVYSIDVSGHGVAAALLSVSLSQSFSPHDHDGNVALKLSAEGNWIAIEPDKVLQVLNTRHQTDISTDQYFTMIYARLNLRTGHVRMCQAGHPNPAISRRDGTVEFVGNGGPPVGLLPMMEFETTAFDLQPGDRLFLYSDGVTECERTDGGLVDEDGLESILQITRSKPVDQLGGVLMSELERLSGSDTFTDDVSALCVELAAA